MIKFLKTNLSYCLIVTLLILLAYSNSFQNSFQYDDFHVILKNPAIKDPANYPQFFLNPQLGSGLVKETSGYRPLLMLSFALNYSLGGLEVFGYHLFNFILHTLCAFLVFFITLLFLRITPDEERFNPTRNQLTALFAASVFALHPVQTESVTYIVGRSNLLTAFFFLLAFWSYMQYQFTGKIHQLIIHGASDTHEPSKSPLGPRRCEKIGIFPLTLPSPPRGEGKHFEIQKEIPSPSTGEGEGGGENGIFSQLPPLAKSPLRPPLVKGGLGGFEGIFYVILSLFSYACALLVKETAVTLLMILLLFNLLFPLGRGWKKRVFSLFPYGLLSMVYLLIRLHFFGSLQYSSEIIRPPYEIFLTQLRAWVHYLGTLFLPLNLNVDYDFPISYSILESQVIFSLSILIALALFIWKIAKFSRLVGFFALWFIINLLPTNSLIPLEDMITDRWLYLPSVGYAVIMALAADWIFQARVKTSSRASKLVFFFLCALVVELYGFATVLRNFTWTSYWTLWEDAAEKSPNKGRPHTGLGLALNHVGRTGEAIEEFKKAIQLNPKAGEPFLNLGYIYFHQGKMEEAIQAFQKAIVLTPRLSPECHNNLGIIYLQQGRKEEGIKELQLALQARPFYARTHGNLGNFYEKEGDVDRAISFMERAAKLEPEYVPVYKALIRLYEKKGWKEKSQEARKNYLRYASMGQHFFIGQ